MRTAGDGAFSGVQQQALGEEAAAAVREAAGLARRRGDSRVTPLHVASAMLAASSAAGGGLLRAACIRSSQARPLQQEQASLDLRLHAALNRLPMAWPTTAAMFHHRAPVALSNALVAVLKRAMARQRISRGRPADDGALPRQSSAAALAHVELEHLVLSILDDPSVDRAMREAGFSSYQVKANVEKINAAASVQQSSSAPRTGTASAGGTDWPELLRPAVVDQGRNLALSLRYHIHSGDHQPSQAKPAPGRPDFAGGAQVAVPATASIPWWLRRHHDLSQRTILPNPMATSSCHHRPKFTELTAENLKIMCDALEQRVPRRNRADDDVAAGIATAVLRCRSGMARRTSSSSAATSSWLLFQGGDAHAKKAVARELADLVFGSRPDELVSITLTAGSAAMADDSVSSSSRGRKRSQDYRNGHARIRLLFQAIQENSHRVVWIDGIDELDHGTETAIMNVIRDGIIAGPGGHRAVSLEDVIVVLSSEVAPGSRPPLASSTRAVKRRGSKQWLGGEGDGSTENKGAKSRRVSFDLNAREEDAREVEDDDSGDDGRIINAVDGVFSFH